MKKHLLISLIVSLFFGAICIQAMQEKPSDKSLIMYIINELNIPVQVKIRMGRTGESVRSIPVIENDDKDWRPGGEVFKFSPGHTSKFKLDPRNFPLDVRVFDEKYEISPDISTKYYFRPKKFPSNVQEINESALALIQQDPDKWAFSGYVYNPAEFELKGRYIEELSEKNKLNTLTFKTIWDKRLFAKLFKIDPKTGLQTAYFKIYKDDDGIIKFDPLNMKKIYIINNLEGPIVARLRSCLTKRLLDANKSQQYMNPDSSQAEFFELGPKDGLDSNRVISFSVDYDECYLPFTIRVWPLSYYQEGLLKPDLDSKGKPELTSSANRANSWGVTKFEGEERLKFLVEQKELMPEFINKSSSIPDEEDTFILIKENELPYSDEKVVIERISELPEDIGLPINKQIDATGIERTSIESLKGVLKDYYLGKVKERSDIRNIYVLNSFGEDVWVKIGYPTGGRIMVPDWTDGMIEDEEAFLLPKSEAVQFKVGPENLPVTIFVWRQSYKPDRAFSKYTDDENRRNIWTLAIITKEDLQRFVLHPPQYEKGGLVGNFFVMELKRRGTNVFPSIESTTSTARFIPAIIKKGKFTY